MKIIKWDKTIQIRLFEKYDLEDCIAIIYSRVCPQKMSPFFRLALV